MKKCLKCGTEYQGNDNFCPVCGEKLTATNVCQKCGRPVSVEETFCRHCGYKIEKEMKCEQCGATLDADAKFCQQCGAKVENPVVTVKETRSAAPKANSNSGATIMNPLLKKILFYAFGGALLLFLVLMLIGCFGDIASAKTNGLSRSIGTVNATQGISYYFGDALDAIEQAGKLEDPGYKGYLIFQYVINLLMWLGTIAVFCVGIALGIVNLTKGQKNGYNLKTKSYALTLLGGLPYLFIIGLQNRTIVKSKEIYSSSGISSSTNYSYTVEAMFGWGTMMILICAIIGIVVLIAYNVLTAIFERKDIVKKAVRGGVALPLLISLLVSIGLIVSVNYKGTSGSYITSQSGLISPHTLFVSELVNYCSSSGTDKFPSHALLALFGGMTVFFGYCFAHAAITNLFDEKNNMSSIICNSVFAIFLLIAGHVLSVEAVKKSIETSSSENYKIVIGAGCIVIIVFLLTAIAGFIVSNVVGKKKEEPVQVQQ